MEDYDATPTKLKVDTATGFVLVDDAALAEALRALADASLNNEDARAKAVGLIRDAHRKAMEVAQAQLMEGKTGLELARSFSRFWDGILGALLEAGAARSGFDIGPGSGFALSCVGGYGRGTLAPYSDLDLLFIVPDLSDPQAEQVISFVLYILWDTGVKVGQATRTVDECIALSLSDMTIRTNILEARFLAGDPDIFKRLADRYWDEVASSVTDFVDYKLNEREARHKREGNSRYRVEPNVKEGKGGLRDLHTLLWIAKYVFRVHQPFDLVPAGLLSQDEYAEFSRCAMFLWTVRTHLHFLAGRAEENLTFNMQSDMAERLGYKDQPGLRAVEAFMKDYFLIAKEVGRFTGIIYTALELQNAKGAPGRPWFRASDPESIKGWPGFGLEAGRLVLTHKGVFDEDPVNLLRLFLLAHEEKLYIHPSALRVLTRSLHLIDDDLRANEEANAVFLDILCHERKPERILRRLNETGVLGAFIPDFGRIEAMMQFNMYHHYTVDEHLIRSIGEIHDILKGSLAQEFPFGHRIARRVRLRRSLIVAMLLHDIAKGRDEDHSIAGERIARELCPRLGLDDRETDTVAWLVREHLILSDTSQRRDIYDPKTARDMAALIKTPERLRLLLVLTIADIRAVGPGTWNSWKGQLLEALFLEVEARFGGGEANIARAARVMEVQEILRGQLPHWSDASFARVTHHFSESYWLGVPQEHHARHARLVSFAEYRLAKGRPSFLVDAQSDPERDVTHLTVVALDKPGLFASLAGVFAASDAYVVGASAFTSANGIVLDMFELQGHQGTAFGGGSDRFRRLRERIRDVLQGKIDVETIMPPRALPGRQEAFTVPPQVQFDNDASITHTVLEVERANRPDLLYRVATCLKEMGMSIGSAHCTNYGELAVDVFYLKDRGGLKITREVILRDIEKQVVATLNGAE